MVSVSVDSQHFSTTHLDLLRSESSYSQEKLPVFPRRINLSDDLGGHQHSSKLVLHLD